MGLGYEKLDVYGLAIGYVAWVYEKATGLTGIHRPACDQWLRASQSVPLNISEGNDKTAEADRQRYFDIDRGSALECAATQDVLMVGKALDGHESREQKIEFDRIAAMLSRLGGGGTALRKIALLASPTKTISNSIPIKTCPNKNRCTISWSDLNQSATQIR